MAGEFQHRERRRHNSKNEADQLNRGRRLRQPALDFSHVQLHAENVPRQLNHVRDNPLNLGDIRKQALQIGLDLAHVGFNGRDPFGRRNKDAFILEMKGGKPVQRKLELVNAALASQAVGPPLNEFEASCAGRTLPDVGRKLLRAPTIPLAYQKVHPQDSVLGHLARPTRGLNTTYAKLIEQAFADKLWDSDQWFDADGKGADADLELVATLNGIKTLSVDDFSFL